jgi:hypothetical protein
MSEFDDPQLQNTLGRLSGEFPDDNVALGAVYQRVQQVRRRRTIVVSTTASLLLMAGVGMAAARGLHHDPLQPGASISIDDTTIAHHDSTTTAAPTTTEHTTTTHTTEPPTSNTIPTYNVPTSAPIHGGGSGNGSGNGGGPTTSPAPPSTAAPTTAAPTTATPTTVAPAEVHTYPSPGGTFTVRFAHGTLSLVDVQAAPGYRIDSQTVGPQRIEFRFRGDSGDFRTRVEVKDGQLQVTH